MQIFVDFSQRFADFAEFCRKVQTIFFPQVFYDVNRTLKLFLNTGKKINGSTGNTGT